MRGRDRRLFSRFLDGDGNGLISLPVTVLDQFVQHRDVMIAVGGMEQVLLQAIVVVSRVQLGIVRLRGWRLRMFLGLDRLERLHRCAGGCPKQVGSATMPCQFVVECAERDAGRYLSNPHSRSPNSR